MKLMIKKKIVKEPYQWFIKLKYQNLSELAENSLMKHLWKVLKPGIYIRFKKK